MKKIFVLTIGNDFTGVGSNSKPFATISKSQLLSHEISYDNKKIVVEEDKYTISLPIEIAYKDNNTVFQVNGIAELIGAAALILIIGQNNILMVLNI
jgi:hypothetical protein